MRSKHFIYLPALMLLTNLALGADKPMARCTLKVDGKYYLKDKSCPFHKEDDGSFTIGVSDKHRSKYFAYVTLEDKIATGKWNGPDGESHADEDLGTLKNVGNGCWSNERAEVCVK